MHEELSALRTAWLGAYEAPNARPVDGVSWHDMLDRVVVRLREWDRCGCARGTHRDDSPTDDDENALQQRSVYIRADVGTRPAPRKLPPNEPILL